MHLTNAGDTSFRIPPSRKMLWVFVVLSLGLHLLLLLAWRAELPRWNGETATLEIQLIEPAANIAPGVPTRMSQNEPISAAPVVKAEKIPPAKRTSRSPGEPKAASTAAVRPEAEQQSTIAATIQPPAPKTTASTKTATLLSRDELLRRIERRLTLLKQYPGLARRRGWEGDVHLTFGVSEQGAISAVRIAISSGFKLLDDNAISTLRQINQLLVEEESFDTTQRMNLAVRYRLTDG